jgi:hypothetical protein
MGKISIKLLILVLLLMVINAFLVQNLFTDDIFYKTYSDQMSVKMISQMLKFNTGHIWIMYLLTPIITIIKLLFVSGCLWIGLLLKNSKDIFKDLWRIVIISEFTFVFYAFIKTGLLYYYDFQTITEVSQFQPLSLFSLLDTNNIPLYLYYLLSLISIPEVTYWIVLAVLLKSVINSNFWGRFVFIAKTYGLGLLIWVSTLTFIIINMTT